jgi:DNA-binding NarL/FixJ family response regulator
MIKMGANAVDQRNIIELAQAGESVKKISKRLLISEKCVASFVKAAKKPAKKAAAEVN